MVKAHHYIEGLKGVLGITFYRVGASSAYIQRVLGHSWWSTTQGYIRLSSGESPVWRSVAQVAEVDKKWLHHTFGEYSMDSPDRYRQWVNKWRVQYREGEEDSEEDFAVQDQQDRPQPSSSGKR